MRKLIYLFHKYLVECHYIVDRIVLDNPYEEHEAFGIGLVTLPIWHCPLDIYMFPWEKLFIYAKNICKTYPIGFFFPER